MAQCIYSFTHEDSEQWFCVREDGHEGQHQAEGCTGFGQIGPAMVPVTFTVLWKVDE